MFIVQQLQHCNALVGEFFVVVVVDKNTTRTNNHQPFLIYCLWHYVRHLAVHCTFYSDLNS